jgi:hypothetical protein
MAREQLGYQADDGCVAPGLGVEVAASGGATRSLTVADSGSVNLFDTATGVVYTLPAPTVGLKFAFYASVSVTSNAYAINTDSAATFIGGAVQQIIAASGTSEGQVGDDASDVTISMNGSTTGGLEGTYIEVIATSTTTWVATGTLVGSGTLATPYA